jgi:hypothetical protein
MKETLKTIAVLLFCVSIIFFQPLTLVLVGIMGLYVLCVVLWSIWKAWGPGHKNEDFDLPDQDIFHQP